MSRGFRNNYWSCSKHAAWVRAAFAKTTKPFALSMGDWKRWDADLKKAHPFVFWYTETFLNRFQRVIYKPIDVLDDLRYWGYNRFVTRPHLLNTRLQPGSYYEIDERMLHGMFETLVDFIEVEKAWMHVVWNDEARKKYHLPWYKRVPYFLRWKTWRSPEAGIEHLKWEMGLVNDYDYMDEEDRVRQADYNQPTSQALAASEQYELYNWWKLARPNRKDPMEASGWSDHCEQMRARRGADIFSHLDDLEDSTQQERIQSKTTLDLCDSIEKNYAEQDEQMLIRLIKIRKHLWT